LKTFITDGANLLGSNLYKLLSDSFNGNVISGNFSTEYLDTLLLSLETEKPDVVIHNLEINNLRNCEENPKKAFKINSLLTRDIAATMASMDSIMIYISSFQVFSGKKGEAYYEFDRPDPANVYGWSKWWGEHYVSSMIKKHFNLRLPVLFGLEGDTQDNLLLKTDVDSLKRQLDPVFANVTNPTWSIHVAKTIQQLLSTSGWGTYHIGNTGTATPGQFVKAIIEEKGLSAHMVIQQEKNGFDNYRYKVLQSAYLPFNNVVRDLPNWRDALKECLSPGLKYPGNCH